MVPQRCYFPFILLIFIIKISSSERTETQVLEARELKPYRSYKDVELFHYTVPRQVSKAIFQFEANGSSGCAPKPIAVYLQYGSFPVMDVRNEEFPDSFILRRLFLHNITMYTESGPNYINISNPMPGNWFAAAFLLETSSRIVQKGLFTPCSGWLVTTAKMQIFNDVKTLLTESEITEEIASSQIYRFFADDDAWRCKIELKNCSNSSQCPLLILAQPNGLPSFIYSKQMNCSKTDECVMEFVPAVSNWNYFSIHNLGSSNVNFELDLTTEVCPQQDVFYLSAINNSISAEFVNATTTKIEYQESTCWARFPLVRISMPETYAYEYNLPKDEDGAYPLIINITNDSPTFTSFEVLPTTDIAGTLVIELAISPFMNLTYSNISVIGCIEYGVRPTPGTPFNTKFCGSSIQMSVNTTSWRNRVTTAIIPFPEAGTWYISFLPQCFTSEDDFQANLTISTPVRCDTSYTSIFIRIRSAPCVLGQCGDFGACFQYVSGGFIFSSCTCIAGWKGWACTDSSDAKSYRQLLMDVLFLTISNVLFIPAIVIAIYRMYYTEALVYFSTMFFSAFYHACEGVIYSFCLIKLPVLQFCDFFSAILSIWVTLIAMAGLSARLKSLAHMAGAIGIALVVKYDKTSVGAVAFPASVGAIIVLSAWGSRCYKTKKIYPHKSVWLYSILPSGILALTGVLAFVLFETEENYPYVHSAWHCLIALSVFFALPRRQIENKEE